MNYILLLDLERYEEINYGQYHNRKELNQPNNCSNCRAPKLCM